MIQEFLTRQEAADLLRITLPTLDKYSREGRIKGRSRIGVRILYGRQQVLESVQLIRASKHSRQTA